MKRGLGLLGLLSLTLAACPGGNSSSSSSSSSGAVTSSSTGGSGASGSGASSSTGIIISSSSRAASLSSSSSPFSASSSSRGASSQDVTSSSLANPCAGVDCAGHGVCMPLGGEAVCQCESGFHNEGHTCVVNPVVGALCANVTCNGHGTCLADSQRAVCHCDPGYALNLTDTNCVDTPAACLDVACNGHGTCKTAIFGGSGCACDPGFVSYGAACVQERRIFCRARDGSVVNRGTTRCSDDDTHMEVCHDGDGDGLVEWIYGVDCAGGGACSAGCLNTRCPDQPCPVGTTCVLEAHQQPLGVCVATCDCSNCGNCGQDNSDGRWADQQEYCGAQPNQSPAVSACNLPCPNAGDGCIPYNPGICWPIEGCFSGPPTGP